MVTTERVSDDLIDTGEAGSVEAVGGRPGSDATLERLRAKILSGELPPGSVVSQIKLAKALGISTTPLREVIRQLQAEGLLEIELNRRPRVAPLDVHDLHGVYAARILFESLGVAMTASTMTDEQVQELRDDLAEMRMLHREARMAEWAEAHNRFHRRLVAQAPAALTATLANFADRTERYRRLSAGSGPRSWDEADQEHERLVDACAARDGHTASRELANHLARTALSLSASFAPEVDPRPIRLAVGMVTSSQPSEASAQVRRLRRSR